jgi:hypothetical protein
MKFEEMDNEQLIDTYVDAVLRRSEARSARVANRHATTIIEIARELRRRGPEAQVKLLPLLEHPHSDVRVWAAGHALAFAPDKAGLVLRRLIQERGAVGATARMTLALWKEGKLVLP